MKLCEFKPGDIVAIVWPTHEYDSMPWLAGTEQLVKIGNVLGGRKKKGDKPHAVLISFVDMQTLIVNERSMRALPPDIEVLDVIERYGRESDEHGRDADGADLADPLQGSRR
jgi:hypothetical protein